ncbi:MAG: helix-turn-helix domain-containing protein [Candidatus Lokiarchaeota archaeon]|nr:helix-turn-helix domain-containing protein [Candidatus Lokiarchaeota archaeon]
MNEMEIDEDFEIADQETLGKKEIRNNILKCLKNSKYGRNLSQIADRLNLSRNTVKRYIKFMEKEELVEVKEIGRSKIAYLKKNYDNNIAKGYIAYILDFYNAILKGVDKEADNIPNLTHILKNVGIEMAKHLFWPPVELVEWDKEKRATLTEAINILNQMVVLFNSIFNIVQVEFIPPISDDEPHAVLRVENVSTRVEDSENFYYISAGFFETKMRLICGDNIFLNVIEYREKAACCYIKLEVT